MKKINFSRACSEISESLLQIVEPTKSQAKSEIKRVCTKYSLDRIPKNYEILATVNGRSYEKLQNVLLKKPVKTASGVAVVALMAKPYACPHGRCTYVLVAWNSILLTAIPEKNRLLFQRLKINMSRETQNHTFVEEFCS